MILNIISEIKDKEAISYRADVSNFDAIYRSLECEEYSKVKDLALEQIKTGCLDPRYVIYAEFAFLYESISFDINIKIFKELVSIHQFYIERIEEGQIPSKFYLRIVEWLNIRMVEYAEFINRKQSIYFEGNKVAFNETLDEYILFIKKNFKEINLTQLYRLRSLFKTFKTNENLEENTRQEEPLESKNIQTDNTESLVNYEIEYGKDEWNKLLRNIQIYRKLIKEESWLKATVVYQVINSAIQQFDPVQYFPEIFYPYLKSTAHAYDHLLHQLNLSEHPIWLMLLQLFNSDPESFSYDDSLNVIGEILIEESNRLEYDQHSQIPD